MISVRRLTISIVALALIAVGAYVITGQVNNTASAEPGHVSPMDFVGLWQGIQDDDGSLATVSISDIDGDGVFDIRQHEFFLSSCNGGFGIIVGTATVDGDMLNRHVTLTCSDGSNQIDCEGSYQYMPMHDILVLFRDNPLATPDTYHRISNNSNR